MGFKTKLSSLLPSRNGNVSSWAFAQTVVPPVLICVVLVWAALHFVHSAPPRTLTISSGPKGSNFESIAQRYSRILGRNGIQLNVLPSQGSLENLQRMTDPKSRVDIALVQSGVTANTDADDDLESLGGMFYQPLLIFYRSPKPLQRLSELTSQRIAIGPDGSGTRFLALALLKANGIEPGGTTTLSAVEGEPARTALLRKQVDAIFLTGDSASASTLRELVHTDGIRLKEFPQADA